MILTTSPRNSSANIEVQYGDTDGIGYFLSLIDKRLLLDAGPVPRMTRQALEEIDGDGGDGAYFNVHSGEVGPGERIEPTGMAILWRRFGVKEEHVRNMERNLKTSNGQPKDRPVVGQLHILLKHN